VRGPTRILTTVVATLLLVLGGVPARAEGVGPCDLARAEGETARQLSRRLIRCATERWPVNGGAARAICIADHESGLDPRATSPGGAYLGLFQHSAEAWPDRYREWSRPAWGLDESALSARTNVIVTIRMVNAGGWGPWAGVDGC
jgi:hypothetical protein